MDEKLSTTLTKAASDYTISLLTQYGNEPNHDHEQAIIKIINGFVQMLNHSNIKAAYPLFCGGGKSTCIRGFLKALHDLGLDYSV